MNSTPVDDIDGAVSTTSQVALTSIYALLGSLGIIGNGFVLVVLIGVKELRTITNFFIVNQSVIDMTTSIFLLVSFIAPRPPVPTRGLAGVFICAVWNSNYIFWGSILTSTFNLVLMTLERYFAVVHPIFYRRKFSYRRAVVLASLPWLLGFGYEIHWALVNRYHDDQCIIYYGRFGLQAFIGCMTFTIQFFIPLAIMTFVYISIVKSLRLRVSPNSSSSDQTQTNNRTNNTEQATYRSRARKNVIKTLFLVSVSFAICWIPNQITYLYFNLGGQLNFDGPVFYITVYLAFINMCVNPFIYTFKYHKFQKGLKKLFGLKLRAQENNSLTATAITAS